MTTAFDARAARLISELGRLIQFRSRLFSLGQPIPKGVYFFKSLDEADAHREAWQAIAIARIGR